MGREGASGPGRTGTCSSFLLPLLGSNEVCSQPSTLVDSEGSVLLSGDFQHLGRGLALTKELKKCGQVSLPTPRPELPCDHISPPVSKTGVGGEEVSTDDLRIWYKWLNQQFFPGETCAGWRWNQAQGRGSGSSQKATPPSPL